MSRRPLLTTEDFENVFVGRAKADNGVACGVVGAASLICRLLGAVAFHQYELRCLACRIARSDQPRNEIEFIERHAVNIRFVYAGVRAAHAARTGEMLDRELKIPSVDEN